MHSTLPLAASARLLTDFITQPVSMHPAHHLSYIQHLHALNTTGRLAPATGMTTTEWFIGGCKGEPWTAPLYAVDAATGIALLEITGPLVKGYDAVTCFFYGLASIDRIGCALAELSTRADVRALVVHLNTPGGMSTGMPELADQFAALATRLPVVMHTSDMACSNGMRLAVAGSVFFPTTSATVGCIGTYIALYNQTKLLEEWGIKLELYRSGKYKAIGLAGKDTTTDEAAFIQASVMRSNDAFTAFVRARCPAVPDEAMEGQWFDGAEAVAYGLAAATVTGLPEVLALVKAQLTPA